MIKTSAADIQARTLWHYSLVTYVALVINAAGYLRDLRPVSAFALVFSGMVLLTYPCLYLLPAVLLVQLANRLLHSRICTRLLTRIHCRPSWVTFVLAVPVFSFVQVLLYADRFVFHLYGFHLNGFVWNLVFTEGGLESLGGGRSSELSFTLIVLALFVIQSLLLLAVVQRRVRNGLQSLLTRRVAVLCAVGLLVTWAIEQTAYGICTIHRCIPVLAASNVFPFYVPTTFTRLASSLGIDVERAPGPDVQVEFGRIHYPLRPIQRTEVDRPYNILWLTAESLRADALAPETMPETWDFARRACRFRTHYSGGNGTRMGVFSMFYGLYGCYWFPFLKEHRSPLLIDVLIDEGYEMEMFTSSKFTYPEFTQTVFSRLPAENLHEDSSLPTWRRDERNVSSIIDFIDHRDPMRPYMIYMFFDSTHANYHFPPEYAVHKPFPVDFNYAKMNLAQDIEPIRNRYLNACAYVDSQIGRLLKHLETTGLLDTTIVLITGDHGQEFMEKGHWGHNSTFSEEQTRVPFVLWVPGKSPAEVTRLTSHLDVPATLLRLLGVTNSPEDYSLGHDLFGETARDHTVVCDWNNVAYVSAEFKAVFPMKAWGFARRTVTTRDDTPVADKASFYATHQERILDLTKALRRFTLLRDPDASPETSRGSSTAEPEAAAFQRKGPYGLSRPEGSNLYVSPWQSQIERCAS